MIYQLVYSSNPARQMMQSNLFIILRQARLNNKLRGITGLLAFFDNVFLQALEGEENEVKIIFEKIKNDTRHTNLSVLFDGWVENRNFPNWEMAYACPSVRDMANWSGLHNATTIEAILTNLKNKPEIAPKIFAEFLHAATQTKQDSDV